VKERAMAKAETLVVLLAIAVANHPAKAKELTAEEMLSNCTPVEQAEIRDGKSWFNSTYETGICVGYLFGLLGTSQVVTDTSDPQHSAALHFCPPEGVSAKQAAAIFNGYVRLHPEKYHEGAFWPAVNAFIAAFPCKRSE
jgi:hypothetical protein